MIFNQCYYKISNKYKFHLYLIDKNKNDEKLLYLH